VHPTTVDCGWQVVTGPEPHLQLSTYGSDLRQSRPKVSQTIQIDRSGAEELMKIIRSAFPEIG
jgi:hypothetical protein